MDKSNPPRYFKENETPAPIKSLRQYIKPNSIEYNVLQSDSTPWQTRTTKIKGDRGKGFSENKTAIKETNPSNSRNKS